MVETLIIKCRTLSGVNMEDLVAVLDDHRELVLQSLEAPPTVLTWDIIWHTSVTFSTLTLTADTLFSRVVTFFLQRRSGNCLTHQHLI